jgi:DNA-binding response OmpR family regulator
VAKILFADDDQAMREMVADIVTSAGHSIRTVPNGTAALSAIRREPPDLAILDYRMGTPDGFEVCRLIKDAPQFEHLPVLILTAEGDLEDRIRGFEAGANDYLPKPFDARELVARIRALLRLSEQARGLNPTTGLPGGSMIEREFERRRASGAPFTLCYLDLDHFKAFNDRFGFATANAVIECVGADLRNIATETSCFAGHIGGDDFVVMCDPASALGIVADAQARLADALIQYLPPEIARRGVYLGRLRTGLEGFVPVTRLAAVLLHLEPATAPSLTMLAELAAEGKSQAKGAAQAGIVELEVGELAESRIR